jgi:molybdopterin synthase sulfur carrier subunit
MDETDADERIQWKLFANLAETAGEREVTTDAAPGDTFEDALEALFEVHPELEAEIVDENGEIYDHIRVLRNGENPFVTQAGFDTTLESGDELALFPPVSGG